tara:strand:- start:161 stop:343 length:183 start_codon:yes stop_codon:yes gene_type:complete
MIGNLQGTEEVTIMKFDVEDNTQSQQINSNRVSRIIFDEEIADEPEKVPSKTQTAESFRS